MAFKLLAYQHIHKCSYPFIHIVMVPMCLKIHQCLSYASYSSSSRLGKQSHQQNWIWLNLFFWLIYQPCPEMFCYFSSWIRRKSRNSRTMLKVNGYLLLSPLHIKLFAAFVCIYFFKKKHVPSFSWQFFLLKVIGLVMVKCCYEINHWFTYFMVYQWGNKITSWFCY